MPVPDSPFALALNAALLRAVSNRLWSPSRSAILRHSSMKASARAWSRLSMAILVSPRSTFMRARGGDVDRSSASRTRAPSPGRSHGRPRSNQARLRGAAASRPRRLLLPTRGPLAGCRARRRCGRAARLDRRASFISWSARSAIARTQIACRRRTSASSFRSARRSRA